MIRRATLPWLVAATLFAIPCDTARAREDPPPEAQAQARSQRPAPGPDDEKPDDEPLTERVVVSASVATQSILDAPAAVSILDGDDLERQPGEHLVDHLRRVPGVNVVQFSARDVNIASRSATGGINNSTLALVDGRSLYQDFLGFILWEFAPSDLGLIDQVEVVRGPASAIWGANAVGGVINVVTRSPRDTLGGQLRLEAGSYGTRRLAARHSFLAGPWAMRVAAGYYDSDAFDRPQAITNFCGETLDPDFGLIENAPLADTEQPRLDFHADLGRRGDGEWMLKSGWGGTSGWIATGLGPFDIQSPSSMSYVQARFRRGPYEAQFYTNYFDGDAVNLINELTFDFTSTLTQASLRGRSLPFRNSVFGWGLDLNRSGYALSIAPGGRRRNTLGAFGELDWILAPRWKLVSALRLDHYHETVGSVLSPRVALRFKPTDRQTLRVAAGRAFRAPSVIETDLDVPSIPVALLDWVDIDQMLVDDGTFPPGTSFFAAMAEGICSLPGNDNCGEPPGEIPQYVAVTAARGSRDLDVVSTDSLEIGYVTRLGSFGLSATVYRTWAENGIDFPQKSSYGYGPDGEPGTADDVVLPTDPDGDGIDEAPPSDVCPFGLDLFEPFDVLCPQGPVPYNLALSLLLDGQIPALFQYDNGADTVDQGVELGMTLVLPRGVSTWLNYSWQQTPVSDGQRMTHRIDTFRAEKTSGVDMDGDGRIADTSSFVNIPAEHRVSAGAQMDGERWYASVSVDHVSNAFWQDVLTSDFWGYTDRYTLVGLAGGWRWPGRGLKLSAQVSNLFDDVYQQHIYGDLIARRASVSLSYAWAPQ